MKFPSICRLAIAVLVFQASSSHAAEPQVLGKALHRFEIGSLIAQDNFANLDQWMVQVEDKASEPQPRVEARDGWLDCYLPSRGATIWFKEKLPTRTTISYEVVCPEGDRAVKGLSARDINNFWLANDPAGGSLFDSAAYTGKFASYDKITGYYASTGGGRAGDANRTIRLRRYPREIEGQRTNHLFLNNRDEDRAHLIRPNEVMTVQLVAYDDLLQYIVDGKVVYELEYGDQGQIESPSAGEEARVLPAIYSEDRFPFYREGYFGFRMVGTHHRYRNFRVHELTPASSGTLTVQSVEELRQAVKQSHRHIRMAPGTHVITELENGTNAIHFTGSHNEIDLTGVKFEVPVSTLRKMEKQRRSDQAVFQLDGDHLTLLGLEIENTYPSGKSEITDFGSYNQHPELHPNRQIVTLRANGDDTTLRGLRLTVRGSSPYGYGNMYGIGGGAVVRLKKHSGILAKGDRAVIDDCRVKMEAFGHAIFFQGGDDILVQNCHVEGELRPSNDLYEEKGEGDFARHFNYQLQWPKEVRGVPIPRDHMINLSEDGIRAYPGTKHVTVKNCRVDKMRAGVKLYLARSAEVTDCVVTDCVVQGYSLPSRGKMVRCAGNAAYGPLLYIHSDFHNNQHIDLTVLPATKSLGDHPLVALKGSKNHIHLHAGQGLSATPPRPIILGYKMRFDFLSTDYPAAPRDFADHFAKYAPDHYRAEGNTLINDTPFPVILGEQARKNTVKSRGPVTNLAKNP
ncbi:DUF6250 domain-containing protein [Roseibacillus ishigakijimensis]|uniref:Right-handed parallel beta-helix repeat-containing protein n=1 Tax=Roseibacillus ishigakijimensis TaxID=454146 RepID=A0A934VG58_9BACT|nr:DUF6250 domain-containing protein [Roseibacillus ishigakijimensis]MBK1832488.1 right-handed parallel beta-helix repeat-containing protein [Roseibacillus ishigakijimensis]